MKPFVVDEDRVQLSTVQLKEFHDIVSKRPCITEQGRPDISIPIAFPMMRVRKPDWEDWRKLSFMISYVRGTRRLPLIMDANEIGILK